MSHTKAAASSSHAACTSSSQSKGNLEMSAYLSDRKMLSRALPEGMLNAKPCSSAASRVASKGPPERRAHSFSQLPIELFIKIASYLVKAVSRALPFRSFRGASTFAPDSTTMMSSEYHMDREGYLALLHLSSLSLSLRQALAPLAWQDVLIQRNDRLGRLRSIADYYQRLESSFSGVGRLPFPLPLIRILRIQLPDQYLSFNQEILRHLLRSGVNPRYSLHTLVWDSELLPNPAIWRMLGEVEQMPGLEAELQQRKERTLNRDQIREMAHSGQAETAFVPKSQSPPDGSYDHAVGSNLALGDGRRKSLEWDARPPTSYNSRRRNLRASGIDISGNDIFALAPSPPSSSSSRSHSTSPAPPKGLQSLSLNCKVFYGGHIDIARLRSLRHLHLTSFDSYLLPPHLPSLLISLHLPLKSIALSSSKTSLLHDWDLIQRGVFTGLEFLDVYPVTPEWPLAEGLRSAGSTLRGLRLILDVSGSFSNFDRLWRDLTAPMAEAWAGQHRLVENVRVNKAFAERVNMNQHATSKLGALSKLEFLVVDPLPQQNTAPSFVAFLKSCLRLRWLNGRRIRQRDGAPPGLELCDFNPDKLSGTMPY